MIGFGFGFERARTKNAEQPKYQTRAQAWQS